MMTRCPRCLRVVLATPHLTNDALCDGVAPPAPPAPAPPPPAPALVRVVPFDPSSDLEEAG